MSVNTRFLAYIKTHLLADDIHNTRHSISLKWTKGMFSQENGLLSQFKWLLARCTKLLWATMKIF